MSEENNCISCIVFYYIFHSSGQKYHYADKFDKTKNYLLVHPGESDQSLSDRPLTARGREQATLAGEYLNGMKVSWSGIVSSRLKRSVDTMTLALAKLRIHPASTRDPDLNEGLTVVPSPNTFDENTVHLYFCHRFKYCKVWSNRNLCRNSIWERVTRSSADSRNISAGLFPLKRKTHSYWCFLRRI